MDEGVKFGIHLRNADLSKGAVKAAKKAEPKA